MCVCVCPPRGYAIFCYANCSWLIAVFNFITPHTEKTTRGPLITTRNSVCNHKQLQLWREKTKLIQGQGDRKEKKIRKEMQWGSEKQNVLRFYKSFLLILGYFWRLVFWPTSCLIRSNDPSYAFESEKIFGWYKISLRHILHNVKEIFQVSSEVFPNLYCLWNQSI